MDHIRICGSISVFRGHGSSNFGHDGSRDDHLNPILKSGSKFDPNVLPSFGLVNPFLKSNFKDIILRVKLNIKLK